MSYNLSDIGNTSQADIVLYQNGTEYMNGVMNFNSMSVFGMELIVLCVLVQVFLLVLVLGIMITKRWYN